MTDVKTMGLNVIGDGVWDQTGERLTGADASSNVGRGNVGSVGFDENHSGFFAAEVTECGRRTRRVMLERGRHSLT
jgi:hypothetical protein